ncbi:6148_t:CDS:2 [Cetraspora pellucida]|uniref:6148_t:CDS:1 n=1 Tax=Cetraspora pellucida TaxID=1433469 RepID=A0ACA9LKE7_9GLOM|nr:6148_t:CDS:2 [Cetraspora pellucida]
MDGKQCQDDFANIDATWSALDCVIYTSTVEANISFEIFDYFDTVIGITNIATSVYVEVFAQMLFRICDCPLCIVLFYHSKKFDIFKEPCWELIQAELSALRPGNLPTIIKGQHRHLLAKYFPEILCSLIASTGVTLELILVKDTEKVNRKKISHTIKNIKEKIKGADAESIVNAPDISLIYTSGDIRDKDDIWNWGMNNNDWVKLCDKDFVKRYNNPEPLQYFRRLAYFRRQGFSDINDTNILFGEDVTKTFKQSQKKIVKIREDTLLLFSFKTRAKGLPDLKATVKLINAIVGNWCGYTVKKLADKTQKLFDLIPITTDITISEFIEHGITYLSSNAINEKALSLEILAHNQTINFFQNLYYANTICEVSTSEKKISNSLIFLSSEFFIKNESNIDILILLL